MQKPPFLVTLLLKFLTPSKFNDKEVVGSASATEAAKNIAFTGDNDTTYFVAGPATTHQYDWTGNRADATAAADTLLGSVATALGNIAADLTALKAFQGAASSTSANLAAACCRIMDTDYATETASLTKNRF